MFSEASVFAVDDDVLNERFSELDAVRKLFADQTGDGRQKQQRTEGKDAEADRRQQDVEERQPSVLLLRLALHLPRDVIEETTSIDKPRETHSVVCHHLIAHPAIAFQRHLHSRHSKWQTMAQTGQSVNQFISKLIKRPVKQSQKTKLT